jgi:hypothetical protein
MKPIVQPFYSLPVLSVSHRGVLSPVTPDSLGLSDAAKEAYIKTLQMVDPIRNVLMFAAPDLGERPDTPTLAREYFKLDTVLHSLGDVAMLTGAPVHYVNRDRERIAMEFYATDIWTEVRSYQLGRIVKGSPSDWTYKTGNRYFKVVL